MLYAVRPEQMVTILREAGRVGVRNAAPLLSSCVPVGKLLPSGSFNFLRLKWG